jgi:signal transduction histidine kinase
MAKRNKKDSQQPLLPGLDEAAAPAERPGFEPPNAIATQNPRLPPGASDEDASQELDDALSDEFETGPPDDVPLKAQQIVDLKGKKVWIIDSMSLIFQLFHAIPNMTSPRAEPVNAVFGFTRDMLTILEQRKPEALGLDMKVEGRAAVGKTPAKHAAAQVVLSVLERLADTSPARAFDGAGERDYALARFLLTQQTFLLDMAPVPMQRWIDLNLFGLHLAPNAAALLEWATGIDELLGLKVSLRHDSHLRTVFRNVIESSTDPQRTLDTVLSRSMDTLEQIQSPEDLETPFLQYLVHLCDVHRCLGTGNEDINLRDMADDWQILYRGQVSMAAKLPDVRLSGRERSILDAALSVVFDARGMTSVECLGRRPLRLSLRSTTPLPGTSTEEICALWSRVSRTTTLEATEYGIDVTVTTADTPNEPGPITQALESALQPAAQPYRAAVANLLHDLKNQLVAARHAASQPAEGRTARLQQQYTASRHLDEAHSLALRVRSTSSLLGPSKNESVELGAFLRRYTRGILDRLPNNISLSVPEASKVVRVALGEPALTAVLNNLVGNAIEALSNGGAITLDWTADEYEAVVEVADNGPGLPLQVADALATDQRIRSTKPGGNGLGLLSVRSLLARANGQLSLAPAQTGTAWLITLPLATTEAESE